jgi:hypothetical protein
MDGWNETECTHNARNGCAGGRWKKSALAMSPKIKNPENSLGLPLHRSDAALLCF